MGFNAKQILQKCDFIGAIPEFRILNEARYKSIFSSILSILLIIFSIVFVIYSFDEYLNQTPKVEYYKNNDYSTNKTFEISDSLIMFRHIFICMEDPSINNELEINIVNQFSGERKKLSFETCELGKNINIKYRDVIKKFEEIEKKI